MITITHESDPTKNNVGNEFSTPFDEKNIQYVAGLENFANFLAGQLLKGKGEFLSMKSKGFILFQSIME